MRPALCTGKHAPIRKHVPRSSLQSIATRKGYFFQVPFTNLLELSVKNIALSEIDIRFMHVNINLKPPKQKLRSRWTLCFNAYSFNPHQKPVLTKAGCHLGSLEH